MNTVARFITRPSATGSTKPDIGVIAFFRNNTTITANKVYEIREVLGELVIVEIGDAVLAGETPKDRYYHASWGQDVSTILDYGKSVFLTKDEHERDRMLREAEHGE